MAQATLDLPDPLAQSPQTAAGTDDLLAQMADAQIDQMLAATERLPAADTASTTAARVTEPLLPEIANGDPAGSSRPHGADHLGDYLGKLSADGPDGSSIPTAASAPLLVSPLDAHGNTTSHFSGEDHEAEAEQKALRALEEAHDEGHIFSTAAALISQPIERHPSIPVRILAFLNAPLDSCSDDLRDLLGKVAILTMVNAVSVLIYVLFFRQHHS
jgi:hypothetical protein